MSSTANPDFWETSEIVDLEWPGRVIRVEDIENTETQWVDDEPGALSVAVGTTTDLVPHSEVIIPGPSLADTTPEALVKPVPWYAAEGLEGMELVLQRVKREARALVGAVSFGRPHVHAMEPEDDDEAVNLVLLQVFAPLDDDELGVFREDLFRRLTDSLDPADLLRLAILVTPQRRA